MARSRLTRFLFTGAAARLAQRTKDIQRLSSFPQFLAAMDMDPPSAADFTKVLRGTVVTSMKRGYTKWALTQEQALGLREDREGQTLQKPEGMVQSALPDDIYSFFPGNDYDRRRGRRGGRRG